MISPAVETFRGERVFLCGKEGKKSLGSQLKEHSVKARAFDYLRRGDVIAIHNALHLKDQLDITEETSVTLEAPAGKPVPSSDK